MNLVRWDPFAEMDAFFARRPFWPRIPLDTNGGKGVSWTPSADISETEKEYLIRTELPAVKKEDVKVTVDGGMITIEGERRQQKEDKGEKFHRVESFYGSFTRSFGLPENANADAIRCEDKDGVLTVHIPKKAMDRPKAKQIRVE